MDIVGIKKLFIANILKLTGCFSVLTEKGE